MTAIVASEILLKYSVTTGTAGNSTVGTSAGSLGKYISTTAWAGGVANDLFPDITGAQNAASQVDYRCIFVHNSNAANTLQGAVVYLSAETAGGASIAVAIDNAAASVLGATAAQADTIASATTAPTLVGAFSSPTTVGAGLLLGDIPSGSVRAFWVRRTAANTAALTNDGVTIAVSGNTGSL